MNKTYLLRYLKYPPCDDCPLEDGKPCDKELKDPVWCYLKLMSEENHYYDRVMGGMIEEWEKENEESNEGTV